MHDMIDRAMRGTWPRGLIAISGCVAMSLHAQSPEVPQWQTAAGGKLAFEVASIKPAEPGKFHPPSFPLSNDDAFRPTGSRFAADFPLSVLIPFAYKTRLTQEQMRAMLSPLSKWVSTESFDIEAKAEGNPTKDQFRLMMQSLLADRFRLVIHREQSEVRLFWLTLARPGKLGPKLLPHSDGPPCESPGGELLPPMCDAQMLIRLPDGRQRAASRNTTLPLIAASLPTLGRLGRPVMDRTGRNGNFDYVLEWMPETNTPPAPNPASPPEFQGPTFLEALQDQLGLKLESGKGPVETLVVDHVERPSEN